MMRQQSMALPLALGRLATGYSQMIARVLIVSGITHPLRLPISEGL